MSPSSSLPGTAEDARDAGLVEACASLLRWIVDLELGTDVPASLLRTSVTLTGR